MSSDTSTGHIVLGGESIPEGETPRNGASPDTVVAQAVNQAPADPKETGENPPEGTMPRLQASFPAVVAAGDGNVVHLPAGVSIEHIQISGTDLLLIQPDGSIIRVENGAIKIPAFVIGDVQIPQIALTAALEANGINVAAGPDGTAVAVAGSQSAGAQFAHGNFALGDAGPILGLLPPTALRFGGLQQRELYPGLTKSNEEPSLTIVRGATGSVQESALPTLQASGGGSTTTNGKIDIVPGNDGLGSLTASDAAGHSVDVTNGGSIVGQYGTLEIIRQPDGSYDFQYTITDNTIDHSRPGVVGPGDSVSDNFSVTVTDGNGDTDTQEIVVRIDDDGPIALADTDAVAANVFTPETGNVMTGAGTTSGAAGADAEGADGASVAGVAKGNTGAALDDAATVGVSVAGLYGTLTLAADGSYLYVRSAGTPGGVEDVFTYTLKDGDGDTSHATLTIAIGDSTPTVGGLTPSASGGDVTVDEDDLAASRGTGESAGSDGTDSTTQTGSFIIASPDGIASLTVDGHAFITNGVFAAGSFATALGNTLEVAAYDAATGTVSYKYTLVDNETHAAGSGENSLLEEFDVKLTDQDGQSDTGTPSVNIIDDAPTAVTEALQNVAEGATVAGTFDFAEGADGAVVSHIEGAPLNFDAGTGWSQWVNLGQGEIRAKAGGAYEFKEDAVTMSPVAPITGSFTVTDGDKDTATAGFAFQITDANTPSGGQAAAFVDDDGLFGGNPASTAGDLDANVGDDPADTGEASFTGVLGGSVGGDGAGANGFSFAAALDGATAAVGTETVTYGVVGNLLTATVTGGPRDGTPLFTVEITDQASGAYKVTLLDNVLHAGGPNDEAIDAVVNLGYTITDADGSPVAGSLLTITFDDDAPTVTVDTNTSTLIHDETPGVDGANDVAGSSIVSGGATIASLFAGVTNKGVDRNVVRDNGAIGFAQSGALVAILTAAFGADGAAASGKQVYSLNLSSSGVDSSTTTTEGDHIYLFKEGGLVVGRVGDASGEAAFALSIDATTGQVYLAQYLSLHHSDAPSNYDEPVSLANDALQVTVTVTDGDGDQATDSASVGSQVIFQDDGPSLGSFASGVIPNEVGTLNGTFEVDFGSDGYNASNAFDITGPTITGIAYTQTDLADGTTELVAHAGTTSGAEIFSLIVRADGTYTFDLIAPQTAGFLRIKRRR